MVERKAFKDLIGSLVRVQKRRVGHFTLGFRHVVTYKRLRVVRDFSVKLISVGHGGFFILSVH